MLMCLFVLFHKISLLKLSELIYFNCNETFWVPAKTQMLSPLILWTLQRILILMLTITLKLLMT